MYLSLQLLCFVFSVCSSIWIACSQSFLVTFSPSVFSPSSLGTAAAGEDDNETPVTYESTLWFHLYIWWTFTPQTFERPFSHRVAVFVSRPASQIPVFSMQQEHMNHCIYNHQGILGPRAPNVWSPPQCLHWHTVWTAYMGWFAAFYNKQFTLERCVIECTDSLLFYFRPHSWHTLKSLGV